MSRIIDLKVVLIGSVGVGKSSLVIRFVKDCFKEDVEPTVGASYMTKFLKLEDTTEIKFSVWDTAGQEEVSFVFTFNPHKYHSLVPLYFRKADAVIVVYDITRRSTFEDAKNWVDELRHQAPEDVIVAITGNKCDLNNIRIVSTEEGAKYAKEINAIFGETSAKDATGVLNIFQEIGKRCIERRKYYHKSIESDTFSELDISEPKQEKNCCFGENVKE